MLALLANFFALDALEGAPEITVSMADFMNCNVLDSGVDSAVCKLSALSLRVEEQAVDCELLLWNLVEQDEIWRVGQASESNRVEPDVI